MGTGTTIALWSLLWVVLMAVIAIGVYFLLRRRETTTNYTKGGYPGGQPAATVGPPPSTPSDSIRPLRPEPQPEPEGGQPLPVVEGKMPRIVTYQPRPGSPPRTCHCHGRPLLSGEDVIWWPVPEPKGAVYLICKSEGLP